jgi:hypothetical protein
MTSKKKVTKRKFYGKWLYKVTLEVPGIGILRSKSPDETLEFFKESKAPDTKKYNNLSIYSKAINNEETITDICVFLKTIKDTEWNKRIERYFIDFYTNSEPLYNDLLNKFQSVVLHHFEPDRSTIDLFKNQYSIITNKYPHNKYRYKVYLSPHKLKKDVESKSSFLQWIDNQADKILITSTVKKWFMTTDWNWDRRYVLVDNEQTLLMLKMRNTDAIGKVYEYILSDK